MRKIISTLIVLTSLLIFNSCLPTITEKELPEIINIEIRTTTFNIHTIILFSDSNKIVVRGTPLLKLHKKYKSIYRNGVIWKIVDERNDKFRI